MDSYNLTIAEQITVIEKDGRIGKFSHMDTYGNFHFSKGNYETILTERELTEFAEEIR